MMEPSRGNPDIRLEDEHEHDQLPSVESYKASAGYRGSSGSPKPDPSGSQAAFDYENSPSRSNTLDDLEQPDSPHDQLPDAEEYKTSNAPTSSAVGHHNGRFWKIVAGSCFGALLLVLILAVTISLSKQEDNLWWLKYSDRYAAIENYLVGAGISEAADLNREASPQHMAAKWIANKDGMKMSVPDHLTEPTVDLAFVERYVLAVFYFATGGPEWTYQLNFLTDNHVCTWYEAFTLETNDDVNLDGDYVTLGIHGCKLVDDKLVPFTMFLPNNNLSGALPEEMKFMDRLEILNLQFNKDLGGTLPSTLGKMAQLRHIGFQWCNFGGTIPSWIGELAGLKYLGLGNNQFTGEVPKEIASLTDLELLGLDDNDLSANIELFSGLKAIKSLYLEDNQITGTLSDALFVEWPKLQELDLSNNQLTGPLPDNFFNHANDLRVVDLSKNAFSGMLPVPGWENEQLEFLALDENKLDGKIPSEMVRLKQLAHLDLFQNSFGSTIPESLGRLTRLEYLFLGNNPFESGPIPSFLMDLTNLRDLSLKNCHLDGTIPDFIRYLTNLQFLDFHYNQLTGTIPSQIGELVGLKHLLLKYNNLSGSIPIEMKNLSNLDVLLLEQNDLVGNAEPICKMIPNLSIQHFVSDCKSEVDCSCCDLCCDDDDKICNAGEWDGSIDPIWEFGFRRERYSYDMGAYVVVVP